MSSVTCTLKSSYTIIDLLKSNSFWFFCAYAFHTWSHMIKPDKHQGLIHPCFFLWNNNKTIRCSISLIIWLILSRNIIIGGNINPSAATVRTTVTRLFSEPEVRIVTDFWPFCTNDFSGTVSKILGFCPYYLSGEVDTFLSLKLLSAIFNKFLFFHLTIALQKLWKMFFISFKNLFSFLRYSDFCIFSSSFPHFPNSKGQMEVE